MPSMLTAAPLPVPVKSMEIASADATDGANRAETTTNLLSSFFTPALLRRVEATRVVTPMVITHA
jgi:hypothetical protein